ncbi:MAG: DUF4282 domain-containing protein [Pirellulaceae bacterium]
MADELFYKLDDSAAEQGPIAGKDLRQLAASGGITPNSLIRRGDSPWVAASSVKGLEFAPPTVASPPMAIPVEPSPQAAPDAKQPGPTIQPPNIQPPVSQAPPAATPVTPPQATPVPPAAESGSKPGLSFPSAPPKQGTQIPGGLGDLKVSPSRPGGIKGPAKTATPPPAVQPPEKPPAEQPSPAVTPPSAPAEQKVEVSPQAAVASLAPAEEGELQMMDPEDPMLAPKEKSKRPAAKRRGGGGGILSVFSFGTLITPNIVKPLYYIYVALVILGWLGSAAALIVVPLLSGEMLGVLLGVVASVATLVSSLLLIMLARVGAELVIVFFRINEQIGEALNRMEP